MGINLYHIGWLWGVEKSPCKMLNTVPDTWICIQHLPWSGLTRKIFSSPLALSLLRRYERVTDKNTNNSNKEHNEKISMKIYIGKACATDWVLVPFPINSYVSYVKPNPNVMASGGGAFRVTTSCGEVLMNEITALKKETWSWNQLG